MPREICKLGFSQIHSIDNNANIGIRYFTKKIQQQNVTPSGNRTTGLGFEVQHAPFYTNLTFACNTETLGTLYSHALLILTGSSKSKNQVVHGQMFKDLPSAKLV